MNRSVTEAEQAYNNESDTASESASLTHDEREQLLARPLDFDLSFDEVEPAADKVDESVSIADDAVSTDNEAPVENIDIGSGYQGPVTPVKRFEKRQSERHNIPALNVAFAPANQGKLGQMVRGMQQAVMVKDASTTGLALRVKKSMPRNVLLKLQFSYRGQTSSTCYAEVIDCRNEGHGYFRLRLRLTDQSRFLNNVIAYEFGQA